MLFLLETVISGLLTGVMYSLVALGFVLIYKASGIFNFSQGVMALFAGLTVVGFMSGTTPFTFQINSFPPWILNAAVVMAGAVVVHLAQRLVRRARGSKSTTAECGAGVCRRCGPRRDHCTTAGSARPAVR